MEAAGACAPTAPLRTRRLANRASGHVGAATGADQLSCWACRRGACATSQTTYGHLRQAARNHRAWLCRRGECAASHPAPPGYASGNAGAAAAIPACAGIAQLAMSALSLPAPQPAPDGVPSRRHPYTLVFRARKAHRCSEIERNSRATTPFAGSPWVHDGSAARANNYGRHAASRLEQARCIKRMGQCCVCCCWNVPPRDAPALPAAVHFSLSLRAKHARGACRPHACVAPASLTSDLAHIPLPERLGDVAAAPAAAVAAQAAHVGEDVGPRTGPLKRPPPSTCQGTKASPTLPPPTSADDGRGGGCHRGVMGRHALGGRSPGGGGCRVGGQRHGRGRRGMRLHRPPQGPLRRPSGDGKGSWAADSHAMGSGGPMGCWDLTGVMGCGGLMGWWNP